MPAPKPEETSAVEGKPAWISKVDNPRIVGTRTLVGNEFVLSNGGGWQYYNFNLLGKVTNANGSTYELYQRPDSFHDVGEKMTWQSRGMKLPRRLSSNETDGIVAYNGWYDPQSPDIGFQKATEAMKIQLSPEVILVPVHFVTLYAPDSKKEWQRAPVADSQAQNLLDDAMDYEVGNSTHPDAIPSEVQYADNVVEDAEFRPDEIWSQCNIQFRQVKYTACPVPRKIVDDPTDFTNVFWECGESLQQFAHEQEIRGAASACIGPSSGLKLVVGGLLDPEHCDPTTLGVVQEYYAKIALVERGEEKRRRTVAHEFGHALGLPHNSLPDNLMNPDLGFVKTAIKLTPGQCTTARKAAATPGFQAWP